MQSRSTLGLILPSLVLMATGCRTGPMTDPMVQRLPPDDQAVLEGAWNNMLTPTDRLDRDLLLDTVMVFQFFQVGVDNLEMTSRKEYRGGTILMTIHFDRARPTEDAFQIQVLDQAGRLTRTERYTGEEVRTRLEAFSIPTDWGLTNADLTEEQRIARRQKQQNAEREFKRRMEQVEAATRPSTQPTTRAVQH